VVLSRAGQTDLFAVAQASGMAVWEQDLETGCLRVSGEYARLLGFPPQEQNLSQQQILSSIHEKDRQTVAAAMKQAIRGESRYDQQYRAFWNDGSLHWLHVTGCAFHDHGAGRLRFLGFAIDVSERRQAEEQLRAAEARLLLAQEAGGVGVWQWDLTTQVVVWTEECARLHGARPGQTAVPHPEVMRLIHRDDAERLSREIQALLEGAGKGDLEFRVALPDAQSRWLYAKCSLTYDSDGKPVMMSGATIDVSARKTIEQALHDMNDILEKRIAERTAELAASNKELEAFAYSVSHDLRAPLRAMNGFSRILLEEHSNELSPEARQHVVTIVNNAKRMGKLIDDLLAFSRIGRQEMHKQTFRPADVVREALRDFMAEIEQRKVGVRIGELPECFAEPTLLRQVYANLASNALKFTRKRDQAVIEFGSLIDRSSGAAVYFVRDNGAGYDDRYTDKLFGVFQRLHSAHEYEGTGVGLAIVQRIVQRHGGRVWSESKLDQGATFYFTLGENV
jgi:PAS domain S-box-containing protein